MNGKIDLMPYPKLLPLHAFQSKIEDIVRSRVPYRYPRKIPHKIAQQKDSTASKLSYLRLGTDDSFPSRPQQSTESMIK